MTLAELATNAELNHWPPHLGVRTDAEKIEYLAQRLREVSTSIDEADQLRDEIVSLERDNAVLQETVEGLESTLNKIRTILV